MVYYQKNFNKYGAKSTIYNDKSYHSKFEASYAQWLDVCLKNGDIKGWDGQVKLDLKVNGTHITNYYIDFVVYHLDGTRDFVECKGFATAEWQLKWKIFEATFDDFKENPDDKMIVIKQSNWGIPKKQLQWKTRA